MDWNDRMNCFVRKDILLGTHNYQMNEYDEDFDYNFSNKSKGREDGSIAFLHFNHHYRSADRK